MYIIFLVSNNNKILDSYLFPYFLFNKYKFKINKQTKMINENDNEDKKDNELILNINSNKEEKELIVNNKEKNDKDDKDLINSNNQNYHIITHQGNVMVNHISIKKVEQNFNNAQRIEVENINSKGDIESIKEEKKENLESKNEEQEEKKNIHSEQKKKKLRVQRTKAPPALLKKKNKGSGLFFCCIPAKNK